MESAGCVLGLGLILGGLIMAFFLEGEYRRKRALTKIKALDTEREKARVKIGEAKEKRQQGISELPGACLLTAIGIILFILAAYLLATV
jgi:multisubunit Na+/H+ antiporter MnhC subunit